MKQISSMFLRNITCIDHAFIDNIGLIKGGSYHQEIIVTGEIDDYEQVVIDFASVKKQIKEIIDDRENGFDHKLWIIKDYSTCQITDLDNEYVKVVTPHHTLIVPQNALKIIHTYENNFMQPVQAVELQMQQEIQDGLNKKNGVEYIRVKLNLTEEAFSKYFTRFTYIHGLKNSSSWGCKNIAHGHTSFVEAYDDTGKRVSEVEKMIAHYIDGSILIFKENLEESNKIAYETQRGKFSLTFSDKVKIILMNKETTIENIVEHIYEQFKPVLDFYAISRIFISEGLQKGALKQIY